MFVATYDGQLGQGRSSLPDQLTRYITTSAAIHALLAVPTYHIVQAVLSGNSAALLEQRPWSIYVLGLLYVVVPALLGAGNAALTRITGRSPVLSLLARVFGREAFEAGASAPSSGDHLLVGRTPGYVRVRLKRGGWVGGFWGAHEGGRMLAHASLYPEARELLLGRRGHSEVRLRRRWRSRRRPGHRYLPHRRARR
ncbi:DUF6338 family protein [Nitriliruptor sp.]|uniref:DUF6338 family protein n=1 Tax=Nitriliruptor sp. TaxID=2448056 RepID=UPI0034A04ADF